MNKPTIEDIIISEEGLAELNKILNSGVSHQGKIHAMRRIAGGYCYRCGAIPTKLVTYDISDAEQKAQRLERYCDKCIITVTATNGKDKTIALKVSNSE